MNYPDSPRLVLHVRLDSFLASIETRRRPEWSNRPLVLTTGDSNGPILALNALARRLGLRPGLRASEAIRLCPFVVTQPIDLKEAEQRSRNFFSLLLRYADRIEPRLLDEAFLDLSDERFARSAPADLAVSLQRSIEQELGLTASIGIGRTKAVAYAASSQKRPNGITIISSGDERAFLYPLPLQRLYSLGERARDFLVAHGIATLGQLAHASGEWLEAQFGEAGRRWQLEAQGHEHSAIETVALTKSLSRSLTFEGPVQNTDWLVSAVQHLTEKGVRALQSQQRSAGYLTLRITDNRGQSHHRRLELTELRSRESFTALIRSIITQTLGLSLGVHSLTVSFERLETRGAAHSTALWNSDRIQAALRGLRGRVEGFGVQLLNSNLAQLKPTTA